MNDALTETLIWASVLLVAALTGLGLAYRAAQRLITARDRDRAEAAAAHDAALDKARLDIDERRHALTMKQETLAESVAAERARLEAEAELYRTRRRAAEGLAEEAAECLLAEMRGTAEARTRAALDAGRNPLARLNWTVAERMYTRYLNTYHGQQPLPLGDWARGTAQNGTAGECGCPDGVCERDG